MSRNGLLAAVPGTNSSLAKGVLAVSLLLIVLVLVIGPPGVG